MTEEKRQELFRDAEPAAEAGRFRLVVGVMGGVGVLAVGWILMALNELRGEVRSVQELETEIRGLRAEVAVLKQDSEEEFNNVKDTLSGVWHLHKPAELEFMGFFASRKEDERRALLAALEELDGNPPVVGQKDAPVPAVEESVEPAVEETSEPVVEENSEPVDEETSEPVNEESPGPGRAHEETGSEEQVDSQQDGSEVRDYTVQRGDSLSRIAQRHKVSAEALARANGISNPNRIRVGQILKIPPE